MRSVKIVILGAGSTSFALTSLATLLRDPSLHGSTLALVDVSSTALRLIVRLAERMNREWDAGFTIESSLNRCDVLSGADFVVCATETTPREALWRQDWEVPHRYGIYQPRAENGGPGGFAHAARNIPTIIDIARDMERVCPGALLIMLSNPLPRLCRAVTKYTSIQVVGLCHQLGFAYGLAGVIFSDRANMEIPPEIFMPNPPPYPYDSAYWRTVGRYLTRVTEVIDIKAAGLNHFTWIMDIRDRRTGEDLYPLLRERFLAFPAGPERLTRDMLQLTGYMPAPGDAHLSEYLPYIHDPITKPWERYGLRLYDWQRAERGRGEVWEEIEKLATTACLDGLRDLPSEGVCELVLGIASDGHIYRPSANVSNQGAISNLPEHTIVEVPVVATGMGVLPLGVGNLPPMVAELCRREAELVELAVDAGVLGSRETALQALCLDPTINDVDVARVVLNDYLEIHREHLPQFHGRWAI